MIKKLLTILLLVVIRAALLAQNQTQEYLNLNYEDKAEWQTFMQKERFVITPRQEEELYDINLRYFQEMELIKGGRQSVSTTRKLKEINDRMEAEIKEVLNQDQFSHYQKMFIEMINMVWEGNEAKNQKYN